MDAEKIYGIFVSIFDKNQKPITDYTSTGLYRSEIAARAYLESMVQAFNGDFSSDKKSIIYTRDDNAEVVMTITEHLLF